jgi:hypothetical protein
MTFFCLHAILETAQVEIPKCQPISRIIGNLFLRLPADQAQGKKGYNIVAIETEDVEAFERAGQ